MATRLARFFVLALLGLIAAAGLHAEAGLAAPGGHSVFAAAQGDSCPEHGHRGQHEPSEHVAAGVVPIPLRDSGAPSAAVTPDSPALAIRPASTISVRAPAFRPPSRRLLVDLCVFRI
ncbi:hypothetical protein [Amycolatopsis minnesotensis]|uniref:hypothetical protein n=1 Tax=Amycolatopsis minnesotensis TaxID=337894 RepID=UPI0031D19E00